MEIPAKAGASPCLFMSFIFVPAAAANRFDLRRPGFAKIGFYECWEFTHIAVTSAKSGSICSSPAF
jgi:hypothetical protein